MGDKNMYNIDKEAVAKLDELTYRFKRAREEQLLLLVRGQLLQTTGENGFKVLYDVERFKDKSGDGMHELVDYMLDNNIYVIHFREGVISAGDMTVLNTIFRQVFDAALLRFKTRFPAMADDDIGDALYLADGFIPVLLFNDSYCHCLFTNKQIVATDIVKTFLWLDIDDDIKLTPVVAGEAHDRFIGPANPSTSFISALKGVLPPL